MNGSHLGFSKISMNGKHLRFSKISMKGSHLRFKKNINEWDAILDLVNINEISKQTSAVVTASHIHKFWPQKKALNAIVGNHV